MPPMFLRLTSLLGFALTALGADISAQDRNFIQDAAKSGMMEEHMGQLGVARGSSLQLKALGEKILGDQLMVSRQLKALAEKKGVAFPLDEPTMPKGLDLDSGPEFDAKFVQVTIEDHEQSIKSFEQEAKLGSDPETKTWAAAMLSTLRDHLAAAKAIKP